MTAINYIETNPEILGMVGEIEGYGSIPNGSINITKGHGKADFILKVMGSQGTVHVHIQLEKEPEKDWQIVFFDYKE